MGKLLYQAAIGLLTLVLLPALGSILFEGAKAAGWVTGTTGMLNAVGAWLGWFVSSQWYLTLVVAVIALGLGVFLDRGARSFDGHRHKSNLDLAERMDAMRIRLTDIRDLTFVQNRAKFTNDMTLAYADLIAFQRVLERKGYAVPWYHWDRSVPDPIPMINTYLGMFALLAPLVREDLIVEARATLRKGFDYRRKGPMLKYGDDLKPMF